MGSTLTAHEAATFYSSAMNTQNILNSRRQPKRFGAGSVVSNGNQTNNNNPAGNPGGAGKGGVGAGGINSSAGVVPGGQMAIGTKM